MKVLLLRGNPRPIGFTQRMTNLFLEGLRETGAKVKDITLSDLSIAHCSGCFHCWMMTPGECVHQDDMNGLLEETIAADLIVCATPLYFFSMSAHLKAYFERLFPLTKPGFTPSAQGRIRNSIRYPERWAGKKLVSLVVGALKDPSVYQPLQQTFELIADTLDLEFGGQLIRPESYSVDYPLSKPKTLKLIETAFIQAGREAGRQGRLSPETIQTAALPLAVDSGHFLTYSNIYWDWAAQLGEESLDPASVRTHVSQDVRILLREMVRCVNPEATRGLRAVLQFEFPDQDQVYHLQIDRGRCDLIEGTHPAPNLIVHCDSTVWAAVFTRQTDVRQFLRDGKLELRGDKSLFARLDRLFPPPSV